LGIVAAPIGFYGILLLTLRWLFAQKSEKSRGFWLQRLPNPKKVIQNPEPWADRRETLLYLRMIISNSSRPTYLKCLYSVENKQASVSPNSHKCCANTRLFVLF
jgi:hypothetical protein